MPAVELALETVLTEVMACLELSGTVQANNYQHPISIEQCSDKSEQEPGLAEQSEQLGTSEVTGTVPPVTPNKEKRLLDVKVPPDRSTELKQMEKEIEWIEMELGKFKQTEVSAIRPNYEMKKSSRKCRPGKSLKARKGIEPMGENGVIGKSKQDMKRMFESKKLFGELFHHHIRLHHLSLKKKSYWVELFHNHSRLHCLSLTKKSYWVELYHRQPRLHHRRLKKKIYFVELCRNHQRLHRLSLKKKSYYLELFHQHPRLHSLSLKKKNRSLSAEQSYKVGT